MSENLIATATVVVAADRESVWHALIDPAAIKQYMFGTTVQSDWQPGSPITWTGEGKGKTYEDKGTILDRKPQQLLSYTHFSPLSGHDDLPQNYHTVTVTLDDADAGTRVTLTQDGNATEEGRDHSQRNWEMMLSALKDFVERPH